MFGDVSQEIDAWVKVQTMLSTWRATALALLLGLGHHAAPAALIAGEPENLAPQAAVSASSEFDNRFLAGYAVDGKVPEAEGKADERQAWCINRKKAGDHGEFTLRWKQPVEVAEVVYFGRTGQVLAECFKDYELYLDDDARPAARGTFQEVHGPQRIAVTPRRSRTVRLKFLNSYGPYNPGASEIAVYGSRPTDAQLMRFISDAAGPSPLRDKLLAGELGFREILVLERHPMQTSHVYTYHAEGFQPGGGLYVYTPATGKLRELVASPEGEIVDCDLAYDGKEVVFSWKRRGKPVGHVNHLPHEHDRSQPDENYQVYRINLDGSGLRQLTDGRSNNLNACWLPDGGIAFISDRKPAYAYCFVTTSPVLYRMERDGSRQRRLSSNYLMDFTPAVLGDGRVLYTRWEYVDRGACPIQSMWTINPDGTGLAGFFKNRMLVPGTFMQGRPIPGTTQVLALATNHNGPCRGGVCILDVRRGANTREAVCNVTPEVDIYQVGGIYGNGLNGPYETPCPIDRDYCFVSRDGSLQLRDYEAKDVATLLRPRGGLGFYSAQPIRARPRPPVVPSHLPEKPESPWATVVLSDVYHGLEGHVRRGEIKRICVVQEIEKSTFTPLVHKDVPFAHGYAANTAFGYQFPLVSCGATYAPKKVWGYADVDDDGSACFQVPTEVPIYFMALDAEGRAVQRMRTFTHLMPGEVQGCVGCHADRNYAMNRTTPDRQAILRRASQPQRLHEPDWGVKGFSYLEVVQPVLDRHCVECHNARTAPKGVDLSGDKTDFFNVSYDVLARKGTLGETRPQVHGVQINSRDEGRSPYTSWISTINGADYNILMVQPKTWGSPASKLADLVLAGHPDSEGKTRLHMTAAERARIMAWIDLNVPYYPTSAPDYPNRMGCRRLMPEQLDAVLQRVAKTRCAECHRQGIPRQFYTRITNPQLNGFLLAPLAKAAGGTEACGRPVFASTADADYQAILKTFEPVAETLRTAPRSDIVAGRPACPTCPVPR